MSNCGDCKSDKAERSDSAIHKLLINGSLYRVPWTENPYRRGVYEKYKARKIIQLKRTPLIVVATWSHDEKSSLVTLEIIKKWYMEKQNQRITVLLLNNGCGTKSAQEFHPDFYNIGLPYIQELAFKSELDSLKNKCIVMSVYGKIVSEDAVEEITKDPSNVFFNWLEKAYGNSWPDVVASLHPSGVNTTISTEDNTSNNSFFFSDNHYAFLVPGEGEHAYSSYDEENDNDNWNSHESSEVRSLSNVLPKKLTVRDDEEYEKLIDQVDEEEEGKYTSSSVDEEDETSSWNSRETNEVLSSSKASTQGLEVSNVHVEPPVYAMPQEECHTEKCAFSPLFPLSLEAPSKAFKKLKQSISKDSNRKNTANNKWQEQSYEKSDFWTGFDEEGYKLIASNKEMPQLSIPQSVEDRLSLYKDASPMKRRRIRSENKEVECEKPFKPQVSIRLANGIAKSVAEQRLMEIEAYIKNSHQWNNWRNEKIDSSLSEIIYSICIGCKNHSDGDDITNKLVSYELKSNEFHFYKPSSDGALSQNISLNSNSDEDTIGSQLWTLPCIEFENIWENLFYSNNLKNELISYVCSLIKLSERGADSNIITVNRMIMLLGPPGTGKTSLCKGLAQLLSIQLNALYPKTVMFEINSHSLFSKWFSESGKLIQSMFDQIDDHAEDKKCMIFVLIDEIESLGMSRDGSSSRGDPADSIRAVNALLTQIDRIRRRQNVLVMCTSNLEKCLDAALVDRTDFIRHVGPPTQFAMYKIFYDCVKELQRIGSVDNSVSLTHPNKITKSNEALSASMWAIANDAIGLSGRAMRQIPAIVLSMSQEDTMSMEECLTNFNRAIKERHMRRD